MPQCSHAQTCSYSDKTDVLCRTGSMCCNEVCAHYQSPANDSLQVSV